MSELFVKVFAVEGDSRCTYCLGQKKQPARFTVYVNKKQERPCLHHLGQAVYAAHYWLTKEADHG